MSVDDLAPATGRSAGTATADDLEVLTPARPTPPAPAARPAPRPAHRAAAAAALTLGRRMRQWLGDRRRDVVTAVAAVVGLVHAVGVLGYPALSDDEGTYTAQAAAVRGGELAHYTYWYDHPPLGWVQLALVDWLPRLLLPDAQPVAAGRLVMVAFATVGAVLAIVLARRSGMSRPAAATAALLGFCSPLAVTLQRQVYLDNVAMPWLLLAMVLVLDPRKRLWVHCAAGAAFATAVLSKETFAVLLPVLAWGVWRTAPRSTRWFSTAGLTGTALLAIAYYPLTALLRGELLPGAGHVSLVDALLFQTVERPSSGPIWQPGTAAAALLDAWLYYDPWLIVGGLAALPLVLAVRRLRFVGLTLLVVVLVALKPGGYLPAMYVVIALPLLGLAAGGALDVAATAARRTAMAAVRTRGLDRRLADAVPAAAALATVAVLAVVWAPGLMVAATTDVNADRVRAERWLAQQLPADAVVLTDDVTWVRLVGDGIVRRENAIWFYKLDTDPEVTQAHPAGWRAVDVVVSTSELRDAVRGNPALARSAAALANSTAVAVFGSGPSAVEIRRVEPGTPGGTP